MKDKFMVILLKELIILPEEEIKIELLTNVSKKIINQACDKFDAKILVVAPISQKESSPSIDDLPKIGVVALIKSKFTLPNGNLRVTLVGEKRVIVKSYFYNKNDEEILRADTMILKLPKFAAAEESAVKRKLKKSIKSFVSLNKSSSNAVLTSIENVRDLNLLTDLIAKSLPFDVEKKLEYMQMINPIVRAGSLIEDIEEELEIIKLEIKIDEKVQNKLYNHEKDFFINEKINALKAELGEGSAKEKEVQKFKENLNDLNLNLETKNKILSEINKYDHFLSESSEASVLYNYLETILSLPWNKKSDEFLNSDIIHSFLNTSHYGLDEVKDRICDYADIKKLSNKAHNPVICLVGPPGIGKTSIASKIAESLNRKFVKISVGGLNDSLELVGSRKTYLGASYGKIIGAIKKADAKNPVILIDEIDKMVKDYKGDPASILLEVLDPVENKNFTDNYIEEPFDLSEVLFILTANSESEIPYVLKDRLEIVNMDSYAIYEKVVIAKKYLLPLIYDEYSVSKMNIDSEVIEFIIKNYTFEAGVRELERNLKKFIRKIIIKDIKLINVESVKLLLGEPVCENEVIYKKSEVGVTNMLAYTNSGGVITNIEVSKIKGTGKVYITGNTGKVMDESVSVALNCVKTKYKINTEKFDLHVHFLSGGVSKDGPSAGCAIASAILSLFLNKAVDINTCFTGEISLTGKVLKIGAAKEKIIAAINNNMKTIYLPEGNQSDIVKLPENIISGINIIYIDNYNEIYNDLFKKVDENENK